MSITHRPFQLYMICHQIGESGILATISSNSLAYGLSSASANPGSSPRGQGLTLAHCSAQPKHFLWDRGCIKRVLWRCLGDDWGC